MHYPAENTPESNQYSHSTGSWEHLLDPGSQKKLLCCKFINVPFINGFINVPHSSLPLVHPRLLPGLFLTLSLAAGESCALTGEPFPRESSSFRERQGRHRAAPVLPGLLCCPTWAPHQAWICSCPPHCHQASSDMATSTLPHSPIAGNRTGLAPVQSGTQQVGLPSSDISVQIEMEWKWCWEKQWVPSQARGPSGLWGSSSGFPPLWVMRRICFQPHFGAFGTRLGGHPTFLGLTLGCPQPTAPAWGAGGLLRAPGETPFLRISSQASGSAPELWGRSWMWASLAGASNIHSWARLQAHTLENWWWWRAWVDELCPLVLVSVEGEEGEGGGINE